MRFYQYSLRLSQGINKYVRGICRAFIYTVKTVTYAHQTTLYGIESLKKRTNESVWDW